MNIGILLCVWNRPERLDYTLSQLAAQTVNGWHLYLINNNANLKGYVDDTLANYDIPATVYHNDYNTGSYARLVCANVNRHKHNHFMHLDDDMSFHRDLVERWEECAEDFEVRSFRGWHIRGDYWDRIQAKPGEVCDYLWGGNACYPAAVAEDARLIDLDQRYWMAEDLWLCYVANHLQNRPLRAVSMDVSIEIDGKDQYLGQKHIKVEMLEMLRAKGWQV